MSLVIIPPTKEMGLLKIKGVQANLMSSTEESMFVQCVIDAQALSGGSFGEGTGQIWLDNVECTGNEITLMNCRSNSTSDGYCTHAQDAGVRCLSGKNMYDV